MWLSEKRREAVSNGETAQVGQVTLADGGLGVYADGERRGVPLYSPGGYYWRPNLGDEVLVVKSGEQHGSVVGVRQDVPEELQVGDVCLAATDGARLWLRADGMTLTTDGLVACTGGDGICLTGGDGAKIWIRSDGSVDIYGDVRVNGQNLNALFEDDGGLL